MYVKLSDKVSKILPKEEKKNGRLLHWMGNGAVGH